MTVDGAGSPEGNASLLDWRSPMPAGFRWPDGRRAAAAFTFDLDAESPILFEHPEAADWLDGVVKVRKINSLTLKQWMEEFTRLKEMNAQMMGSVKAGGKPTKKLPG